MAALSASSPAQISPFESTAASLDPEEQQLPGPLGLRVTEAYLSVHLLQKLV